MDLNGTLPTGRRQWTKLLAYGYFLLAGGFLIGAALSSSAAPTKHVTAHYAQVAHLH